MAAAGSLGPLPLVGGVGFPCSWIPKVSGGSIAHRSLTPGILGKGDSVDLSCVRHRVCQLLTHGPYAQWLTATIWLGSAGVSASGRGSAGLGYRAPLGLLSSRAQAEGPATDLGHLLLMEDPWGMSALPKAAAACATPSDVHWLKQVTQPLRWGRYSATVLGGHGDRTSVTQAHVLARQGPPCSRTVYSAAQCFSRWDPCTPSSEPAVRVLV